MLKNIFKTETSTNTEMLAGALSFQLLSDFKKVWLQCQKRLSNWKSLIKIKQCMDTEIKP